MEKTAVTKHEEEIQEKEQVKRENSNICKYIFLGMLVIAAIFSVLVGGSVGSGTKSSSKEDVFKDICSSIAAGDSVKASDSDYIAIVFDSKPNEKECKAFLNAASKLSKAIAATENDYNATLRQNFTLEEVCGLTGQNNPVVLKQGEHMQDLVITALLVPLDGEKGTLGFAGPCIINEDNGLTLAGVMLFDTADTALLEENKILEETVLHEMMHVLGYGVTWTPRIGADGELVSNYTVIQDKVFTYNDRGEIIVHPKNEPKYTGAEGIAEFEKLTGKEESFIPIQGAKFEGKVAFNVSAGQGRGQLDGHIDKDTFQNALMTFSIDINTGPKSPLTAMSLAMLRDIGYTVDTSIADEYVLPPNPWNRVSNLRGSHIGVLDLSNDILRMKPVMLSLDDPNSLEQLRSRKLCSLEEVIGLL
eukprot:snap_masked-scaffold_6-processed-gene-5.18-mRNA-1 protein AED:1.00 eAED:1.00 QI:0/0/0/0/1/1/2/0/417